MHRFDLEVGAVMGGEGIAVGHQQGARGNPRQPGAAAEPEPLTLADGVVPEAGMLPENAARRCVDDVAWGVTEVMPHELGVGDLAEKADALTVLAALRREVQITCDRADFGLVEVTYRKVGARELRG